MMMMGGKTDRGWKTGAVLCKRIARSWSRLSNRRAAGWRSAARDPTKCPAPPGLYLLRVSARCKEMNCLFLLLLCKIRCDIFICSLVYNRYVKKGYTTLHKKQKSLLQPTLCHLDQRPASHFTAAVTAKVAFIWAMYGLLNVGIFCVLILFAVNVFLIFARSHPSLANVTLWLCMVFNIQFDNAQAIFLVAKTNKTTAKSTLNERRCWL